MKSLDQVLKTIEAGEHVASQALSIVDRARGMLGRGGPRWHRWRALRLRLRAARVEGAGRRDKARALRIQAALHLGAALRGQDLVGPEDARELAALGAGVEPEAEAERA